MKMTGTVEVMVADTVVEAVMTKAEAAGTALRYGSSASAT